MHVILMILVMLLFTSSPVSVSQVASRVSFMSSTHRGHFEIVTTTRRLGNEVSWSDVRLRLDLPLTHHAPVGSQVTILMTDASITMEMAMTVRLLPAGMFVGMGLQDVGEVVGRIATRSGALGAVAAGSREVGAPAVNWTPVVVIGAVNQHDHMLLGAKTRMVGRRPSPVDAVRVYEYARISV